MVQAGHLFLGHAAEQSDGAVDADQARRRGFEHVKVSRGIDVADDERAVIEFRAGLGAEVLEREFDAALGLLASGGVRARQRGDVADGQGRRLRLTAATRETQDH